MILVPLIGFVLAVAWFVREGFKSKRKYAEQKAKVEKLRSKRPGPALTEPILQTTPPQGQTPDPAEAMAGGRGQKWGPN
jgi:hypothetical protein